MSHRDFAAGVVVFHVSADGARRYLVIKNAAGHWELPKGHANPGESWQQTALRELREETGLHDVQLIPGFARQIRYVFRDRKKGVVRKIVYFALGRTGSTVIGLSREHTDFAFLLFEQAIDRLTHAGTRAVVREADAFMRSSAGMLQSANNG